METPPQLIDKVNKLTLRYGLKWEEGCSPSSHPHLLGLVVQLAFSPGLSTV